MRGKNRQKEVKKDSKDSKVPESGWWPYALPPCPHPASPASFTFP